MAESKQITLNPIFADFVDVYIQSFCSSYLKYGESFGAPIQEMPGHLKLYASIIMANGQAIFDTAAADISKYLYTYNVYTEETVDEYKIIYFLGMAIERALPPFKALKGAHLISMIGLLDYRLKVLGIDKPRMRAALVTLIRGGELEKELGPTGCYLLYKCISTAERKEPVKLPPAKVKGTGLDSKRPSLANQILGAD
jgi:hypothetical protein